MVDHLRSAVHLTFHRHRDQPLHFLGGMPRPLGDEFDHGRRQIGIGVDRQPVQRARSCADEDRVMRSTRNPWRSEEVTIRFMNDAERGVGSPGSDPRSLSLHELNE